MIGMFIVEKNRLPNRRTELYEKGVQMMVRGGSRNAKVAAVVLSPLAPRSGARGREPKEEVVAVEAGARGVPSASSNHR